MTHKLKPLIALIGTALLATTTVAVNALDKPFEKGADKSSVPQIRSTRDKPGGIRFLRERYQADESFYDNIPITVERTECGPDSPSISVKYATHDGTATEADYHAVSGTLTWQADDPEGICGPREFYIQVIDNAEVDGNKTVNLTLSQPRGGAKLEQGEALFTIFDNDGSVLGFSQENFRVNEDGKTAEISIARTHCIDGYIPAAYAIYKGNNSGSTATEGADYDALESGLKRGKKLRWAEGECGSKTFDIPIVDDSEIEGYESISLKLIGTQMAIVGQSTANLTIIDNDFDDEQAALSSLGNAIVLAGIARPKDTLFPHSNEYAQRMYRLLKERGFTDEGIIYMNPQAPDLDGDGYLEEALHDYPLAEPASELAKAFEQAASGLEAGQQFVLYWHGHALPDYFRVKQDYELSANGLNDLLKVIPSSVEQVIILDSCYSGSFIDELQGVSNRIVLTSADASNRAWEIEYDSFSNKLIRELRRGETIGKAFLSARDMISRQPALFGDQDPWLDDDGDGVYSVSGDGRRANKTYLGREGVHASVPPEIVQIHPPLTLTGESANGTLWVKVIPNREEVIKQVSAVLVQPDFQSRDYQGEQTHFTHPELTLQNNAAKERYEVVYDYFCTGGDWRILYKVQSVDGVWSDIEVGEVQQASTIQDAACSAPMKAKMDLNQTRYTAGNALRLNMRVEGTGEADFYVAIVFPEGHFMTLTYPDELGLPNTPQPYMSAKHIAGESVYPILDLELPPGLALGGYAACGVLIDSDSTDVLDQTNWIHSDCLPFEMY